MPTLEHNALVEMFRENPRLAPHLIASVLHIDIPAHASVAVVESSLDQLLPTEFRADLVIELRDARGAVVLAIILEVQRDEDPDKLYSWPVYVAVVRAKKRCPVALLVVAPDADVARWATQPIDLGPGLGTFQPLVLGPASVPEVTDPAEAALEIELSVLSAVAHGNGPSGVAVVKAALAGLERLDREHAVVYFQVLWNGLRAPMRRALEAMVMERQADGTEKMLPFMQHFFELGEREGKLDGLREGELKGLREGRLDGLRDALLRLIARTGIALSEGDRARIRTCEDTAALDRWIENVLGAKTVADILS